MVDLDEPRFERRVDHDVDAEDLECARAVRAGRLVRVVGARRAFRPRPRRGRRLTVEAALLEKRGLVLARERGQHGHEHFDRHGPHAPPERLGLGLALLVREPVHEPAERALRADVRRVRVLVRLKVVVELVDRVVCEVHAAIVQVLVRRLDVLLGAQAHEAVVEEEHAERRAARHEHVQPQVKLEPVDEQRLLDVLLRDHGLHRRHAVERLREEDAAALAPAVGLDDKEATRLPVPVELRAKVGELQRKHPRARVEGVVLKNERESARVRAPARGR